MQSAQAGAVALPTTGPKKATVYVAGLHPAVNEQQLLDAFVTFGDILEVNMPADTTDPSKHRGFAFLTFSSPADAQDAIDNYDLNELPGYRGQGRFLKCSVAQPDRFKNESGKAFDRAIWESEEYMKKYVNKDDPRAEAQDKAEAEGDEA
ncbi:hypothetical protein Q5752_003477 [Cryptotrichosporon argae]